MDEVRQVPGEPAAWFVQHADRLVSAARGGRVLDLACGRGRHSLAAARLGLDVLAVDRNRESLAELVSYPLASERIEILEFDLEAGGVAPLEAGSFGAVLVFRYLHRPLMPWIASLLAPGGVLLYETFTVHQRTLGWGPKRADFLLDEQELRSLFPTLAVESYAEGLSDDEPAAYTARLMACRPG